MTIRDAPPARLAHHVRARRQALRLSVSAAAAAAGIGRDTWATVESGNRRTADTKYAGIETALRWAPGSIERVVFEDGEPEPLDDPPRLDHTQARQPLGEFGGHAPVVEIRATDDPRESLAIARVDYAGATRVEIHLRYTNWAQPVKIGDAVEYTCQLVCEPLPENPPSPRRST